MDQFNNSIFRFHFRDGLFLRRVTVFLLPAREVSIQWRFCISWRLTENN